LRTISGLIKVQSMNKKLGLILLVVMALTAGGAALYWWANRNSTVLRIPGIVEIQEVRLGSKVGGRVYDVLVSEGAIVKSGDKLIEFEAPELENQKLQLQAKLVSARAELARIRGGSRFEIDSAAAAADAAKARSDRVQKGWRDEEIRQAKSELEAAQADYDQALKDWVRNSALYRDKSIPRSDYDAALAYRDRARGRKNAAEAKLSMSDSRAEDKAEALAEWMRMKANLEMLKVSRPEDIKVAEAKVAELEENLRAVQINLDETIIRVPPNLGRAVVEVLAVRPGDLVQPNQPVVRVLRNEDLWVKIFVPETQYGLVTLDKKVKVTIDSHPGKEFNGVVIQRSNISEFTPRNVQSVDERRHQVFGVKVRVTDAQGVLNAGMAAEVTIPLE
jgi:multidrug resistance efflux pump